MNKREICRFIEKLGGYFNTDLRLWIIKNKYSSLLMDYLKNNGIKYGRSKDGFFRIVTKQNHIIYVKAVKENNRLYVSNSFLNKLSYFRELDTKNYRYVYKDYLYRPLVYKYTADGKRLISIYDFKSKKIWEGSD